MAFRSIGGEASVHLLVIPRKHDSYLEEIDDLPEGVAKRTSKAAQEVAEKICVAGSSYTSKTNDGGEAGQELFRLRAHVVGDSKMEII